MSARRCSAWVWPRFCFCSSAFTMPGTRSPIRCLSCGGATRRSSALPFVEGEKGGADDEAEGHDVVPPQGLAQIGDREDGEDDQRDDFLHRLELGRRINLMADAVGRHRQTVFQE